MSTSQEAGLEATREQWEEIVAQHAQNASFEPRRQHPRHASYATAKMAFHDARGGMQVCYGAVMDISVEGLTLRCTREIPERALLAIQLDLDSPLLSLGGKVMHCTETVGGYKVGVILAFNESAHATTEPVT